MLDPVINNYFSELKEKWLKKNIKATMDNSQINELKGCCEQQFSLNEWLPKASKRAGSRSFSTHPSKFSHPSTGVGDKNKKNYTYVTPVICNAERANDGFLRTGCVITKMDSLGNAAELDVDKFLTLVMTDGNSLLEHIQQDTDLAKSLLTIKAVSYQELKSGFMAMVEISSENITSSKIKQVYFPIYNSDNSGSNDYHLLSLLTNSGMVYQLRERLDKLRFSDEVSELREKKRKNELSEQGISEIYGLTTIGYGGTKPQNISVLNNQNGGKAHLLSSLPPSIEKRDIHFPKSDFFIESFKKYDYADTFKALHKLFQADYNNINIRNARDRYLQDIMDSLIEKMWAVRSISKEQFHKESSSLSSHQIIWLYSEYEKERVDSEQWLDKVVDDISRWISRSYEKLLAKQAITLGEEERLLFVNVVEQNREFLK
ncbi:type I-F CRISPR-associated protein Csy1 [Aliivibrio finisterrensis]|uniref:type I-F CRISPR-associated protein Csy1 n=1 Tax=Aliivibrio finisterrensis TaxID=511998 RepID=UPI0010224366|nr:type I-F CRISPR-associated protein Csy1 [Aliivibrio finisterrensis]RYU68209.1 type I-F CRISPR-associated protein Csy1 [Aliivibrio finisterrensis]RYU71910.1 type I-F CRISPR-associated protein Csy1 [Aliivibrio finisterrensis]RYU75519.1 type I-F CRISPR-associated protein Csy1 [Aliivibrio finisterrensis]